MSQRRKVVRAATALAALGVLAAGCGQQFVPGESIVRADHPLATSASETPTTTEEPTRTVEGEANAGDPTTTAPKRTEQPPATTDAPDPQPQPTQEQQQPPQQPQPKPDSDLCTAGDLKLSLGQGDAGAGTVWRPLRFTNISKSTCEIQGFPGVSYVAGAKGGQVGAAAFREGTKGAPIKLKPGRTAHAPVGFAQVRNYDSSDCKPTETRGLRVYPPQETNSMYVGNEGLGCASQNIQGYHLKVQTMRPGSGS